MAGILDWIDQNLGTRLGLLVNNPSAAMQQMNQQAGAYNQASLLATQAERNAIKGLPITPEQAAAKQYVDKKIEDVGMGFAGTTSLKSPNMLELYHGTSPAAAKAIEKSGFDINKAADGTVWFTSNPNIGEVAASNKGAVVKRLLDKNKMKLGGWAETDKYSTDELINMGYDGLMLKNGDQITYQIFNPQKLQVGGNVSKNKIAPQQSALDIASQNAEKMLGLPKGNTPMDRAKAMGYNLDVPLYRGTTKPEVSHVGQDIYATTDPKSAEFYASNLSTLQNAVNKGMSPNIMPLYGSKEFVQPNAGSNLWSGGTAYQIPAEYMRSRFAAFDPARMKEPDILAAGVPLGLLAGTNIEMPKKEKRK